MKNKAIFIAIGGLVLVAVLSLAYFCWPRAATEPTDGGAKGSAGSKVAVDGIDDIRKVVKAHVRGKEKARKKLPGKLSDWIDASMFARLSDADRELCESVQEAMDANDGGKTIELCSTLMASSDPAARSHAVDALGWFGVEALPELTTLMGDPAEDVAQSAINAWESGILEIDDPAVRLKISNMALSALVSKDALQSISAQFSMAATEYIDAEEDEDAACEKRSKVIQAVVDMIESPKNQLADAGRELYEDITGHEWQGIEEAERYLDDPDNYEPPEDREEAEMAEQAEEVESSEEVENVEPVEKADEANGGETEPEQEDAEPAQEDAAESEQKDADSEQ